MSAGVARVARNAATKGSQRTVPPSSRPQELFRFQYQAYPTPLNICTLPSTRAIVAEPSHPRHIQMRRRLDAFDPGKLHWTVRCPMDVSKKSTVRNWVRRRVRAAFTHELRQNGWGTDGEVLEGEGRGSTGHPLQTPLTGALCITITHQTRVVTASGEEVQRGCRSLLRNVLHQQQREERQQGQWRSWGRKYD